jgi:hypothetical protein
MFDIGPNLGVDVKKDIPQAVVRRMRWPRRRRLGFVVVVFFVWNRVGGRKFGRAM